MQYLAPLCAMEIVLLIFVSSMLTAGEQTSWWASSLSLPTVILTLKTLDLLGRMVHTKLQYLRWLH